MAKENEFVKRIRNIDGVAGCLLIRRDGVLLGQAMHDLEVYSELLKFSGELGSEVMKTTGFSYFRHLCFSRKNKLNFYVFPIDRYLLGIEQRTDCSVPDMLNAVYKLIDRVLAKNSGVKQNRS